MNRRQALAAFVAIGLATTAGCNAGFWGNWGKKAKTKGFEAVKTGMNEKQVVALMGGAPNRRAGFLLEGHGARAVRMMWLQHNAMHTVTFVGGTVYHKQKTT